MNALFVPGTRAIAMPLAFGNGLVLRMSAEISGSAPWRRRKDRKFYHEKPSNNSRK